MQVGVSHERLQGTVKEYEGRAQSLQEELEFTRSSYGIACQEITDLKDELLSLESVQDQQQLLVLEVCMRVGGCGPSSSRWCWSYVHGWMGVVCCWRDGWVWS